MKKKLLTITGVVICLLLSGCGNSERYEPPESRVTKIEAELQDDDKVNKSESDTKDASEKPRTETGIVLLTPVEPDSDETINGNYEPDEQNRLYYSSLEELVELYRSGEWDGGICYHSGGKLKALLDTDGEILECGVDEYFHTSPGTDIYPDLPDGYTWDNCIQNRYIEYHYECVEDTFTCLEPDGVHCYHRGQETGFWPIAGINEKSQLYPIDWEWCVVVDDRILRCVDNGEVLTVVEGVIGRGWYDGADLDIITFKDNEIQAWGFYHDEDLHRTMISDVTAAACTATLADDRELYTLHIVFTDKSNYTYFVDLTYDGYFAIEDDDFTPEVLYQYCLGQETPEYYVAEYRRIEDACREIWQNEGKRLDPAEQFLAQYCNTED